MPPFSYALFFRRRAAFSSPGYPDTRKARTCFKFAGNPFNFSITFRGVARRSVRTIGSTDFAVVATSGRDSKPSPVAGADQMKAGAGLESNQHRSPASKCRRITITGQATGTRLHHSVRAPQAQSDAMPLDQKPETSDIRFVALPCTPDGQGEFATAVANRCRFESGPAGRQLPSRTCANR